MGIELSYGFLTLNFILRRPPLHPLCIGCGAMVPKVLLGGLGFPVSRPCSPHNSCLKKSCAHKSS